MSALSLPRIQLVSLERPQASETRCLICYPTWLALLCHPFNSELLVHAHTAAIIYTLFHPLFPTTPLVEKVFDQLTGVVKRFSHEIVKEGGVVRSIQNHGIQDLPTRFKARYPDAQGNRYYRKGRFISIYFDSNPYAMKMAENVLNLDAEVLRYTNLKARSPLDYVNTTREDRNPYIRRINKMERQAMQEK